MSEFPGKRALPAAAILLTACATCGIENEMTLIKPGMKPQQVEAILGQPTHVDENKATDLMLADEVYHYSTPGGEARVIFVNGAVLKAELLAEIKS